MAIDVGTTTVTTPPKVFYYHKTRLKSGSWTVTQSSDGTTFNASGDQITSGNAGAGGWDNDFAWAVLRDPSGVVQWLFQRGGGGDNTLWYISRSPASGFTGGGATTRPSASDEETLVSSGIFLGGPYDVVSGVQTSSPWAFYVHTTNSGYPEPDVSVMYQPISGGVGTSPALLAVSATGLPETGFTYGSGLAFVRNFEAMMTRIDAALTAGTGSGGGATGSVGPAPSITFMPSSGSSRLVADSVDVTIVMSGTFPVSCSAIWISSGSADSLLAWDGTGFVGRFTTGSSTTSVAGGSRFTIKPDSGWFASLVAIDAIATNVSGAVARAHSAYHVTDFVADTPPYVSFSPNGGAIGRGAQITIDVTASTGLESAICTAALADGSTVMVFSGSVFGDQFDVSSTSSALSAGRRYAVVHDQPGWTSRTFTLMVAAVDASCQTTSRAAAFDVTDVRAERSPDARRLRKVYPLRRT